MSVVFKACNNTSDPKTVNKDILEIASITCNLKHPSSIQNPTIILKQNNNLKDFNYGIMSLLGKERKYFVVDKTLLEGGLLEVKLKEDVLTTFMSEIKKLNVLVERQETKQNPYIVDEEYILQNNYDYSVKEFGIKVNVNYQYYLTVN